MANEWQELKHANDTFWDAASINYTFLQWLPDYYLDGAGYASWYDDYVVTSEGIEAYRPKQEQMVYYILEASSSAKISGDYQNNIDYRVSFSDVININFQEEIQTAGTIFDSGVGGITFLNAHLVDPNGQLALYGIGGYPLDEASGGYSNEKGDVILDKGTTQSPNTTNQDSNIDLGDKGFWIQLHELGHAFGGLSDLHGTSLHNTAFDNMKYTMMSFNPYGALVSVGNVVSNSEVYAHGLQLFDIKALQDIYGTTKTSTRASNTEYLLGQGLGLSGASANDAFLYTIWDGGGEDIIDASGFSVGAQIDLRQGHFSSIGVDGSGNAWRDDSQAITGVDPDPGNVAIAYGTVIENAKGTAYDDDVIGNDADNKFFATLGSDDYDGNPDAGSKSIDSIDYGNLTGIISVTFTLPTEATVNQVPNGDIDTLKNIEIIFGTAGDDTYDLKLAERIVIEGGDGGDTYMLPDAGTGSSQGQIAIIEKAGDTGTDIIQALDLRPDNTEGIKRGDNVYIRADAGGPTLVVPLTIEGIDPLDGGGSIPVEDYIDEEDDPPRHAPDAMDLARNTGSPLILDLGATGITLTSWQTVGNPRWDIDQDEFAEKTGWIGSEDGFLAIDHNLDGKITEQSELFGTKDTDGFIVLSAYDTNSDNIIDANDIQFSDLLIWVDANGDAISQSSELNSLSYHNIESIDLSYTVTNYQIAGNDILSESTYTLVGGAQRQIVDAWFAYDDFNTDYVGDYVLNPIVYALPNLRGYGTLKDLNIAMSEDETLLSMVQDLSQASLQEFLSVDFDYYGQVEDIMFRWAGVDQVDPASRGAVDGQVLGFMEAYVGVVSTSENTGWGSSNAPEDPADPNAGPKNTIDQIFAQIKWEIASKLLTQTTLKDLLSSGDFYDITGDLSVNSSNFTSVQYLNSENPNGYGYANYANEFYVVGDAGFSGSIQEYVYSGYNNGSDSDLLIFQPGITLENVRFEIGAGDQDDLFVHYNEVYANGVWSSDTIMITDQFRSPVYSVENAYFSEDGIYLDLYNNMSFGGSGTIYGRNDNNTLTGRELGDIFYGYEGNDTYIGNLGDDIFVDTSGDDRYIWNIGDGNDVIHDDSGQDTIVLGPGITLDDISFSKSYNDLIINIFSESLTIDDAYYNGGIGFIETMELYSGEIIDLTTSIVLEGTALAETIDGTLFSEKFLGKEGDDTLKGALGDDGYIWNIGDGNDIIIDASGNNYIEFGAGISEQNLTFYLSPSNYTFYPSSTPDLYISVGTETIRISNQYDAGSNDVSVHEIRFFDGATLDLTSDLNLTGTDQAEDLWGFKANDTLEGLEGDDDIYGMEGIDTVKFSGEYANYSFGTFRPQYAVYSNRIGVRDDVGNDGIDNVYEAEFLEFADGTYEIATGIFTLSNLSPIAQDDAFTTNQDAPFTGLLWQDHGNGADTDPEGDPLSYTVDTVSTNGATISSDSNGWFLYSPTPGYFGTDTFNYTVSDGNGGQDTATVTITVMEDTTGAPTLNRVFLYDGNIQSNYLFDSVYINTDDYLKKTHAISFETGGDITTTQVLYEQGGGLRGLNMFINNGVLYGAVWNFLEENWGYKEVEFQNLEANTEYTASLVMDGLLPNDGHAYLYVNGQLEDTEGGVGAGVGMLYAHDNNIGVGQVQESTYIHTGTYSSGAVFTGEIEKLAHYNAALSGTDIDDLNNFMAQNWLAGHFTGPTIAEEDRSILLIDGVSETSLGNSTEINTGFHFEKTHAIAFETGSDVTTTQVLYEQGGSGRGLNVFIKDGKLFAALWDNNLENWGYKEIQTAISANTKYTMTLSVDGNDTNTGTAELYLDGVLVGTDTGIGEMKQQWGNIGIGQTNGDTRLEGNFVDSNQNAFSGNIERIVQYNRVLEGQERHEFEIFMGHEWITTALYQYGGNDDDTLNGTTSDEVIHGYYGDDILYGDDGSDALIGGLGADTMTGGNGADTFFIGDDAVDTITDFDTAQGDALNIASLLTGYDPTTDAITDFVEITDDGTDSTLKVDADGGADNFVTVATLTGVTGLTDEDALEVAGNLIA